MGFIVDCEACDQGIILYEGDSENILVCMWSWACTERQALSDESESNEV